jgi:hypothetical protein
MQSPQYTSCVNPEDYQDLNLTAEEIVAAAGLVAAIFAGPAALVISLIAGMSALLKVCDYIMGGKLVCLGSDECGIGRVTEIETVDNKSGFEKIDNDYCLNLLLSPHDLDEFQRGDDTPIPPATKPSNHRLDNYKKVAADNKQGRLITEQFNADGSPLMPMPHDGAADTNDSPSQRYAAYDTSFKDFTWDDPLVPPPDPGAKPISIPVLHTEIEGNRAYYVCKTLNSLANPIPHFCGWKPWGIPIGHWVCSVVLAALTPIVLAALAGAWWAGSDDNRDFEGAGYLVKGDQVIIIGRWVFDAGHGGYNELHAVKGLLKLDPIVHWSDFSGDQDFMDWHDRWCQLLSEIPPGGEPIGTSAQGLTPEQQQVQDRQNQPENRWFLHPLLDGCTPPGGQGEQPQPTTTQYPSIR